MIPDVTKVEKSASIAPDHKAVFLSINLNEELKRDPGFFKGSPFSKGVRHGYPLSPLLFVLGVEILAQRIRQSTSCRGITLPQSVEAKISQFADDITTFLQGIKRSQRKHECVK